jgi:hypothetical protein
MTLVVRVNLPQKFTGVKLLCLSLVGANVFFDLFSMAVHYGNSAYFVGRFYARYFQNGLIYRRLFRATQQVCEVLFYLSVIILWKFI